MADVKQAQWDHMKGRIKEAWGVLTDDELDRTEGKIEQLVATIREKTGEAADAIERKLKRFAEN